MMTAFTRLKVRPECSTAAILCCRPLLLSSACQTIVHDLAIDPTNGTIGGKVATRIQ